LIFWRADKGTMKTIRLETPADVKKHIAVLRDPGSDVVLSLAFALWCGHCQAFAPLWKRLKTSSLRGKRVICLEIESAAFPALEDAGLAGRYTAHVAGFPMLTMMKKGSKHRIYSGERTMPALEEWMKKL
jgi:thiol-disulfide isomerase/thioredoxin